MTAEVDELYQSVVLAHARAPRNLGALPGATHSARGDNPFCGDRVEVSLIVQGERITDARFEGVGCAISIASASMMTVAIEGRPRAEVEALRRRFEALLDGDAAGASRAGASGVGHDDDAAAAVEPESAAALGELGAFLGVRRFPARVKCASLAWQTLAAALEAPRR